MQPNQPIPSTTPFLVRLGDTDLKFRDATINDPKPTGRQIIEAAGGRPADEYLVLEWIRDGELNEIELDVTTDLTAPGAERFIVAKASELFKFEIDGKRHSWPAPHITRDVLLLIADQDPAKFSVWQEFQNKPDEEIVVGHPAKLDGKGTERFYTVMKHTTEGMP